MKNRILTFLILVLLSASAGAQEFRALWADAFHAGLRNSTETSALIAAARAAKCNAVVVEIRKRGDAYYRNGLEPVATDVASGFDPLGDLITKGHTGTPRIEVHAWIVTYNIWNNQTTPPTQPTHPYNLHPDWLCENNAGTQWDGGNYQLDPGHPAVQQHTFNVAMDIITRYDVDGLHFDYVRYSDSSSSVGNQPWGYNPVTMARYQALTGTSTIPAPTNAAWLQWRRDQVTALVRKVYLNAWAVKPNVRISAALIAYSNPPANLNLSTWQSTEPYGRTLQDWRGWMEEGILDLACPMLYRNESTTPGFAGWADFTKDRQYNRAAAIGMGWYLNTISNTTTQIGLARAASSNGNTPVGVVGYSYGVPNNESVSQSSTWAQLVAGPFASTVTVPTMPWKTNAAKGHVMGYVLSGATAFDGVTVTLTGPVTRTFTTDATGFFGSVDLPVGTYTITVNQPGYRPLTKTFVVSGAAVAQPAINLELVPLQVTSVVRAVSPTRLTITWNSVPGRTYRVEGANALNNTWSPVVSGVPAAGAATSYQWTVPVAWSVQAFVRVVEE